METRKDQVPALAASRTVRSMENSLLDPVQEPETKLDSMTVRPLQTEGKLQSSPHSSTDSLSSMIPIATTPPRSDLAVTSTSQSDVHADSFMASDMASPMISSPKTYEELQIALQRGYGGLASAVTGITGELMQQSPLPKLSKTNNAHNDDKYGSSFPKMGETRDLSQNKKKSENWSQNSVKASSKSRPRQLKPNAEGTKNSGIPSASISTSLGPIGTFNLPSSFFS